MGGKHTLGKRILSFGLSTAIVFTGTFSGMGSLTRVKAANPEDGLKLYYDFVLQNSFATEINDASGNMNSGQIARVNGKPEGNYEIHDVNLYGKEVKALKLPGGTDGTYLKLPDNVLNQSEDATISMWVRLTTDTAYQRIWDIGTGTSKYMYLLSDGANEGFKGYASAITTSGWSKEAGVSKEAGIAKNRWVLTTVVMDGTQMSLYENGQLVGTKDTGIQIADLGETTGNYVGYSNFGDAPTAGEFAEIKIYDKALSAEEISAMYDVTDEGIVAADKAELVLGDLSAVTEDLELPKKGANGSAITWESTNSAITITDGKAKITRPAVGQSDAAGSLKATITYQGKSDTKEFPVTVLAELSDQAVVEQDAEGLVGEVPDLTALMSDFVLPLTGKNGSVVTWKSENSAITVEGAQAIVKRPEVGSENATGRLIATVKKNDKSKEVSFDATVLAYKEAVAISEVDKIEVVTLKGHSPLLPNFVRVHYSDGSEGRVKAVWPAAIDAEKYSEEGNFTVEGSIVDEKEKLTANVTVVDKEEVAKTVVSSNFDLTDISLDGEGSILTENRDRDLAYLKLLDKDRMLYNFYKTFGMTDKIKNVSPLGGWDEPTGLLRGHSTGHYLSALSLAYASTKDETIKENLDYVIHELREMQKLSKGDAAAFTSKGVDQSVWSTNPNEWGEGFLSAYSPDQFALLEKYTPYAQIWAPYYTLHKIMAGLLDAYTYTGNEEALETAEALGKWVCNRLNACSQEQLTKMWDMYIAGEFGGFNESLATLYLYTEDETFLKGAKLFDNTKFFDKLAVNVDDIQGRHANQHIPQIIGALKTYEATVQKGEPEVKYYDIAENFWQMVVSRYAYSIGGVGTGEKFTQPYRQANSISGTTNCETCAAYNLLKLTKMLNNYDPSNADYMDYYERTLTNQILASQTPNVTAYRHNGTTYMLPIGPGSTRGYGGDYDSFTCCHGTGMENHVKYQEAAYVKTANELYVGLYMPTTVTWGAKGVKVVQTMQYPSEDTQLKVEAMNGIPTQSFDMLLRVPYWATEGFEVKVNGEVKAEKPAVSTYFRLKDIKAGDVIDIHMPWTIHLDKTPDQIGTSTVASLMYGPFVMAAKESSTNWKTLVLSANLPDSVKASVNPTTKLPNLTANKYQFAPMFSPEFATEAYDAYFKVITAADDGSAWYEATVSNATPKYGTFTLSGELVKEGTDLVITAAPAEGYKVKKLIVNGETVTVGEDNTYTVKNVRANVTIEGSFGLINPPAADPAHLEFSATASSDYTASWETVDGVCKDWEPTKSQDGTGKGWGNWPQDEGSEHYLQYSWDNPVKFNRFDIFWYDDGAGTQIPSAMKVLYQDAKGEWQEANMLTALSDASKKDAYNTILLDTVQTDSVKLVMTVRSGSQAMGIYRWKVSYEMTEEEAAKEEAITEAQGVAEDAATITADEFTSESYAEFAKAVEGLKEVLEKEDATAQEIKAAVAAVKNAKEALKKKESGSDTPTPAPTPSGGNDKPSTGGSVTTPTTPVATTLAKPSKVKAKVNGKKKQVTITCKKVAGAQGYEIYRAAKKNGKFKKVATVRSAKNLKKVFKKMKKGTYFYKVKAFAKLNGKNVTSDFSKTVKVKIK